MKNKLLIALLLTILAVGLQGKFMRLSAQPSVDFSYSGVCVNSPTLFTVNTAVTNVNAVSVWNWDFGDGNFSNTQDPANTYLAPGTYTVILTITDTAGVMGSSTHFVTIQPLPVPNFSYDTPNCQNEPVQFRDLSSTLYGNLTTWIWNFGDGSPQDTVHFPNNPNVTHLFPTFGTFNVTLTVINSDSCTNTTNLPVVVTPGPIANFYFTGKCEDQMVQFNDASFANGAGNIVAWDWNFGDPTSGINNISNLTDPTHIFSNPGTYTVCLIVVNFNNCRDTMCKQVQVYPHPPVDFKFTNACLNELVYFNPDPTVTNLNAIGTWNWDFGDGGTSNARNTAHSYTAPGTYTVLLTVTDTAGCINSVSHDVTIHQLPVAHFDAGISNCAGAVVTFNELSSTNFGYVTMWVWDYGDGSLADTILFPGNPNRPHIYISPGTYNVTLTIMASDSCTNFETQSIIIHPNPVANFDFGTTCFGSPVDFTDLSQNNGGGSLIQWNWNFGDPSTGVGNVSTIQNPSHSYSAPGIYIVTLTVATSNGCTDVDSATITVKPNPPIDFTTENNCQNNAVLFHPNPAIMNLSTITSWSWAFGDGGTSPLPSPSHNYTTSGVFSVTLTVVDTGGCTSTITKPVTIVPQPTANFDYSQPACKGSMVQFFDLSINPVGYIVRWTWDFNDGNITVKNFPDNPNVTHTFSNYGTYNVSLTIKTSDSCTRTFTKPVVIAPNPLANFSFLTTCMNSPVQFNDLSQPGSGSISDWLWNFGDPPSGASNISTLQNPSHSFSAPISYSVILTVTNSAGCKDSDTITVNVHALPAVDFSSISGCVNDSTSFVSSTFVNAGAVTSRVWDFGDGFNSTDPDPFHIYTSSGAFTVTLTVTDTAGCINVKSHTVSITPPPTAFFQASTPACANNPVFFNDLSTLTNGQFTSWTWDFGDGNDTVISAPGNPDISHVYTAAGNYTVHLKVNTSQGCEAEFPLVITISASPLADFSFDNTCTGSAASFTSLATPNGGTAIIGYLWDFGDPPSGINNTSNLQNPSHIYATPGTYTVILQVTNADACPDTISHTITVLPKPPVDYSWVNTCLGTTTEFTVNTTVTNIPAVQTFDWDFGDGTAHSTQQDPDHTYNTTGNFTVLLLITDTAGCMNSKSYLISISPKPTASFSFTSGCLNTPVIFTDESFTSSGEAITGWNWDFGDLGTSTVQNPSHIYSALGIYNVTLIATSASGCQDTTSLSIQVFGLPTPGFTFTAAPCNNGAVYFQDSSFSQQATIVGWLWEFEPNQFSTLQNPVHVFYASDSCYTVKLTVTDLRGCQDTISKQVCVPAQLTATFNSTPTCLLDSTYFTPQLLTPADDSLVFFNWNFGDPASGLENTSTLREPSHYYSVAGTYTVIMQATDIHNCLTQKNQYVTVNPLPVPQFSFTNALCDTAINFNESSTGTGSPLSTWIWTYGDGTTDTIIDIDSVDVRHHFPQPGMYQVTLTVINGNNCSQSLTDSVLVRPCIQAVFDTINTPLLCQNYVVQFTDSSYSGLPITSWYWDFGDGNDTTLYSAVNPFSHIFTEAGTYSVKMLITTSVAGKSISDSTTRTVHVQASPEANYTVGRNCFGVDAEFTNITATNGVALSSYQWIFGDPASKSADTSLLKNPTHLFTAPGDYTVQLIATNTSNCQDTVRNTMHVQPLPTADFTNNLSCAGNLTEFIDRSDSVVAPISTWNWTFSGPSGLLGYRDEQNPTFTFNLAGMYTVQLQVIDTNGCVDDTVNTQVEVHETPTSIFDYSENFNDIQGQVQFLNSSIGGTDLKYFWDFGNGETSYAKDPVEFYKNDGRYTIMLVTTNELNCTDTTRIQYEFMVKGLYIPNAFSPNNPHDGVKLFKAVGINLELYRIEVFDRWGNILWHSDKLDDAGRPLEGWDGKYNGELVQEGVYVWKALGVFRDGTIWNGESVGRVEPLPKTMYGTVTLIK